MDKMIEVRYAGAVVARSALVRDVDPQGLFLSVAEPMPVGTELLLKVGDEVVPGKVAAVSESQELARAGMRVQFLDADEAALFGMALAAAAAAPPPVPGSANAPTAIGAVPSGGSMTRASVGSGRVAAAVGRTASGGVAVAAPAEPSSRVAVEPSGRVAAAAVPVATGGLATPAEDEGEAHVEPPSAAHLGSSGGDRPPVPREPEISGPVSSGTGGGAAGAGAGPGGGGRKNRRNRRR